MLKGRAAKRIAVDRLVHEAQWSNRLALGARLASIHPSVWKVNCRKIAREDGEEHGHQRERDAQRERHREERLKRRAVRVDILVVPSQQPRRHRNRGQKCQEDSQALALIEASGHERSVGRPLRPLTARTRVRIPVGSLS